VSSRWEPRRILPVAFQVALVFALLGVWLSSEEVRASKSLVVLFLYSLPSEFLVGLVPHEPVLLYFGTYHAAWVVAVVSVAGTVLAEALNYRFFSLVWGPPRLPAASKTRAVARIMELFERRPMIAILIAGFTPVPFFPIRLLVVMTGYPRLKYLLGVLLSRTPRFWVLAALGAWIRIPGGALVVLFALMLLAVNLPALGRLVSARDGRIREG